MSPHVNESAPTAPPVVAVDADAQPRPTVPWKRWVGLLVFVIVVVVAFINLGEWQLQRLEERRDANAVVVAHESLPTQPYAAVFDHVITDADAWQKVTITGTFDTDPAHQLIARYRSNDGATGYEVVVPLKATDGRIVLINRGFIERPAGQDFPSSVAAPPSGQVTIVGHVRRNEQGPANALTPSPTSVKLISSDAIGQAFGLNLVNGYIGLLEMTPAQQGYQAVRTPPLDEGPHLSYALQWFTFSVIAFVGLFVFIRNDIRDRKKAQSRAAARAASSSPSASDAEPAP